MATEGASPSLHNLDLEQSLLGAIILDNRCMDLFDDLGLTPVQFYDPVHGRLFQSISQTIKGGLRVDGVTLVAKFRDSEDFKDLNGAGYLATLIDAACDTIAARDYASLIVDLYLRREVVRVASEAIAEVNRPSDNFAHGAKMLEVTARALVELETGSDFKAMSGGDAIDAAVREAQEASRPDGIVSGHSVGITSLDLMAGRLRPEQFIVIGARPSMGKSALAVYIGLKLGMAGVGVGYLSPEMASIEHGFRLASAIAFSHGSKIPYQNAIEGRASRDDLAMLAKCNIEARRYPLMLDDRGDLPFDQLRARTRSLDRQMQQRFGVRLSVLVVDHLGLINPPNMGFGGNRVAEVSQITKGLKQIARTMGITVIALSQLNRSVEDRDDKRPRLRDLRESGSIEQDADQVWFLYRDEYYVKREMDALFAAGKKDTSDYLDLADRYAKSKNQLELEVAKRRGGAIGRVKLSCHVAYNHIDTLHASDEVHDTSLFGGSDDE